LERRKVFDDRIEVLVHELGMDQEILHRELEKNRFDELRLGQDEMHCE
jgi:hypothetical protein